MPYGNIDLGQHWLRQWFVAWWQQAIAWANADLSSKRFRGIHLRASLQDLRINLTSKMCLEITLNFINTSLRDQ